MAHNINRQQSESLFTPRNAILQGDCIELMRGMERESVDFILTDPPYITRYRGRDGRTVANDDNARWLRPAFKQMHRVLKNGGFCVSFYGWNKVDLFVDAWRAAGSFIAYAVRQRPNAEKANWTAIGVAWPHKTGGGFNIELEATPLDGRIVLMPPKDDDDSDDRG